MLSEREKNILKIIVLEYVKTAKPVSSSMICDFLKVSSATVRNDMAYLEEMGYLEKEHTSSGRIPSDKGYNFYVDHLLDLKKISGEDMLKLQLIFQNKSLELSDTITKSLEIVSQMTDYATIKLGEKSLDNRLQEIKAINLGDSHIVAIVVTDKGYVEHKNIYLPNVTTEDIEKTIKLINDLIVGTPLVDIREKLEFNVKPVIGKYIKQHEVIYDAFFDVFNKMMVKDIEVLGEKNILKIPEFKEKSDKTYKILESLEEKNIANIIDSDGSNITVCIGKDTNIDDDVTVIKTSYNIKGEKGTLAIVGPKRMEYERVMNMLKYIKEQIERLGEDNE